MTHLGCGGNLSDRCITNFLLILTYLLTLARSKRLRSAETRTLFVSRTRTNFGDRAFSAAGPRVRNYPPTDLRQPDLSYSRLRQSLKAFSFVQRDQSAV